jgi:glycosyltransferase involved in cell wall biosynthesis
VTFVLVGQGPEKDSLEEKVKENNLDNVIFMTPIPKKAIPSLLDEMDVLFLGAPKESLYRYGVSPTKLFDYMMASKPIICAIEASNDIIAESGGGYSVKANSPDAIAEAVLQLLNISNNEKHRMGFRNRKYVTEFHNYSELAQRFLSFIGLEN